jgi:hypothetical protein
VLGLVALVLVLAALTRRGGPSIVRFLLAGVAAGCAFLAKTEMGLAALAAGVTGAFLSAYPGVHRRAGVALAFAGPAVLLPVTVYTLIAADTGWHTLLSESWLLFYNAPPELALFNSRISGFDDPLRSVERMLIAALKLVILGAIIGAISTIAARRHVARSPAASKTESAGMLRRLSTPWRVLLAAVALLGLMGATTGLDWDKGPYLAMPLVLIALLVMLIRAHQVRASGVFTTREAMLMTCCVYALVSLARTILHVRSGGAYGAYLLPVSVVIFTYAWMHPFADRLRTPQARQLARTTVLVLLIGDAVITAGLLAYRYRTRQTVPISTARGTIIAARDLGQAWNEALAYIAKETPDDSAIAVLPEGTSINFLSNRKNPLREEITTPGFLDAAGEARAIRQLEQSRTALILVTNRPTREFGPEAFGRDYSRRLMRWIAGHYVPCAMFGPVKDPALQIGDAPFFIRAYCPRSAVGLKKGSGGFFLPPARRKTLPTPFSVGNS